MDERALQLEKARETAHDVMWRYTHRAGLVKLMRALAAHVQVPVRLLFGGRDCQLSPSGDELRWDSRVNQQRGF